jgi:hypothetical protein
MKRSTSGPLDQQALSGTDPDRDRMRAFHALDQEQQAAAIHRMADEGFTESQIASATRLSVEFIRRVLAERCT